jgi:hypothetical protein
MPRSDKKPDPLRALMRQRISGKDPLWDIYHFERPEMIAKHGDRVAAIVSGTLCEQSLEIAIVTHLIALQERERLEIFEGEGAPLGTFASRITMAYGLGIIGPSAKRDLGIIKKVRNAFAHAKGHLDFDTPAIVAACSKLNLPNVTSVWDDEVLLAPTNSKEQYLQTAKALTLYLTSANPDLGPRRYDVDHHTRDILG